MKTKVTAFLFSLLPLFANATDSKSYCDFYFKAENGIMMPKKLGSGDYKEKPKKNLLLGMGIGKRINPYINMELLGYYNDYNIIEAANNTVYTQKINIKTLFLNTELNLIEHHDITPYVILGVGFSHNNAGTYRATGKINGIRPGSIKIQPAFNVGIGVRKKFTHKWEGSISYKYLDLGRAITSNVGISGAVGAISNPVVAKLNNHAILLTTTYHF
jgi:opacity protein-like surface antigen